MFFLSTILYDNNKAFLNRLVRVGDVFQFYNGNCSVSKVVVALRNGKQEHVKSINNI